MKSFLFLSVCSLLLWGCESAKADHPGGADYSVACEGCKTTSSQTVHHHRFNRHDHYQNHVWHNHHQTHVHRRDYRVEHRHPAKLHGCLKVHKPCGRSLFKLPRPCDDGPTLYLLDKPLGKPKYERGPLNRAAHKVVDWFPHLRW